MNGPTCPLREALADLDQITAEMLEVDAGNAGLCPTMSDLDAAELAVLQAYAAELDAFDGVGGDEVRAVAQGYDRDDCIAMARRWAQ